MKIIEKQTIEVEVDLADMDAEKLNTLKRSVLVDEILELREQIDALIWELPMSRARSIMDKKGTEYE